MPQQSVATPCTASSSDGVAATTSTGETLASRPPLRDVSGGRGCLDLGACEHERVTVGGDDDTVARLEVSLEQPQGEWVLEEALDGALERPRAVGRIPAGLGQERGRLLAQLEAELALGKTGAQAAELQLDDLPELVARQRAELDDLVDPVQELGAELLPHRLRSADVRGHDQHAVPEVHGAALPVGQA